MPNPISRAPRDVLDIAKPVRGFHRYSHNDRADRAASFRLTQGQRQSVGEVFWTHELCPGVCFPTRKQAMDAAIATLSSGGSHA